MELSELIYKVIEGTEDFVEVVDVDFGGGWEWDEFHAWYSPSKRRYFWASGAGCSCNSWSDDIDRLDDFENGTKDDLSRSLKSYFDESYHDRPSDAVAAAEQVRTFRP